MNENEFASFIEHKNSRNPPETFGSENNLKFEKLVTEP